MADNKKQRKIRELTRQRVSRQARVKSNEEVAGLSEPLVSISNESGSHHDFVN